MIVTIALQARNPADRVVLMPLAPEVYAAVRREPPGLAVDSNVMFVVREKDVVMVDANIGPQSANATLDALARVTTKPVSAVIATHYHDDHLGGFATVKGRFPGVRLFAHKSAPDAIQRLLKPAREQMVKSGPEMAEFLRQRIASNKSVGGWPLSEEEKESYLSDIFLADRYAQEMAQVPLPDPDELVGDAVRWTEGGKTIEILHLGEGHTPSDLVVWLPAEKVVASGDLVVYPVPLVGGNQSNVVAWPQTLAAIEKLSPTVILPGHGPVLHDLDFVKKLESLFVEVTESTLEAKAKGGTLEEAKKTVTLEQQRASFCGESGVRKVLFDNYVHGPALESAWRILP